MEKRKRKNDDPSESLQEAFDKLPAWIAFLIFFGSIALILLTSLIYLGFQPTPTVWLDPKLCSLGGVRMGDPLYLVASEVKAAAASNVTIFDDSSTDLGRFNVQAEGLFDFSHYTVSAKAGNDHLVNQVTIDGNRKGPSWQEIISLLGQPEDLNTVQPDPANGNEVYNWQGYLVSRNALQPDLVTWLELKPGCKAAQ